MAWAEKKRAAVEGTFVTGKFSMLLAGHLLLDWGGHAKQSMYTCRAVLRWTKPSFWSRSESAGRVAGRGERGASSRIL